MTIGAALRAHLLDDAAIAALVTARVYPLRLPQKAVMPSIVLTRISGVRWAHLRGAEALVRPRYQVDCWAATHDAATQLGTLVRQRLNGFAGTWTSDESPLIDIHVQAMLLVDERDLFEEEILGGLCRHSADYFLYHATNEGSV
jgi:hypothetical protein